MMSGLQKTSRIGALAILGTLVCGVGLVSAQGAPGSVPVPVPRFTGPVPVTDASHPYMMASELLEPLDLAAIGYVEEEYFVSGMANVYDWAANRDLTVKTARAPYTTRILVRRPSDAARFSGNAIVEVMHAPWGQDFGLIFGWSYEGMIERGDAWIGVTSFPSATVALKKFDPARYATISFANPVPVDECEEVSNRAAGTRPLAAFNNHPSMEDGLRWDMFSQIAALLKSDVPNRPLAALTVRNVFMTAQDTIILTYLNAIHHHANLASGRPVYDGYVVKGYVRPARIRRCAPNITDGDGRIIIQNVNVPVIQLQMEGDFPNSAASRRADSDAPNDRFRLYEIAGTAHFDSAPYRKGFPSLKDMANAGFDLPFRTYPPGLAAHTFLTPFPEEGVGKCVPEATQEQPILGYVIQTAFQQLADWVDKGIAPPRAPRLELENVGTEQARVKTDQFGNAVGGMRTPYVDVPYATYHMHHASTGNAPRCRQFGWEERFDWVRLQSIHGSYAAYAAKVETAVAKAISDRWLTPSTGMKVREDMLSVIPARPAADTGSPETSTR